MIAFVEKKIDDRFINVNCFKAFKGFNQINVETIPVVDHIGFKSVIENRHLDVRNCLAVGSVRFVENFMDYASVDIPASYDYPSCLDGIYNREIEKKKISEIGDFPKFIKPIRHKAFTGFVADNKQEALEAVDLESEVWTSEVKDFFSEFRVFISNSEVFNGAFCEMRFYNGDEFEKPKSFNVEEAASKIFEDDLLPNTFSFDIGLMSTGLDGIIEVNDIFSLGAYGLNSVNYAKLLKARWLELRSD